MEPNLKNKLDEYLRVCNYLSVAQLYLLDNPLLREPLTLDQIKPKIVGHWGTIPGQNFIYAHLNRLNKEHDLDMIFISGPGHGGQASVTNVYLEGSYSKVYPNVSYDYAGLKKLCKQFSFPGGISSHAAPETPGSINEGGELGYSLSHAYGAVIDNKDLIVACVVGDGEAETGPLATSWNANKFINPEKDGTVLPILHLNGYKIANPTVMARIPHEDLIKQFEGYGYEPIYVKGTKVYDTHDDMASALDKAYAIIKEIKSGVKRNFPVIILDTPKGWTGPEFVDGKKIEGNFLAHQIPFPVDKEHPDNLEKLESWLRSYDALDSFDENGAIKEHLRELIPNRPMGANPHANGGLLKKDLVLPDFRNYGVEVKRPGSIEKSDMRELGRYVRDVLKANDNFKAFGPDEFASNRLQDAFEVTGRNWQLDTVEHDDNLSTTGKVFDSYLSEHLCEGMLEGYLLTGRHGFMHSYEAFIRIVDSMTSQHAKWLKVCNELDWREEIASLNYVLSSHVWQQDHNGYTHQDPGFLNHIATKKPDISRIYLPFDANTLISCFDHVIQTENYINVIVASKHPRPQWLGMDDAVIHCTKGLGVLKFASNDEGYEPDIVMTCAGDTPTLEVLAATKILRTYFPELKIRVVNVVDLMKLQARHEHGISDEEYDSIFTTDRPIVFAFHGYPNLIHELTYKRNNDNLHVRGYIEEGTITTPFDMRVQNKIDRYNLVILALEQLDSLGNRTSGLYQYCQNKLVEHKNYIADKGKDLDEVINWTW